MFLKKFVKGVWVCISTKGINIRRLKLMRYPAPALSRKECPKSTLLTVDSFWTIAPTLTPTKNSLS